MTVVCKQCNQKFDDDRAFDSHAALGCPAVTTIDAVCHFARDMEKKYKVKTSIEPAVDAHGGFRLLIESVDHDEVDMIIGISDDGTLFDYYDHGESVVLDDLEGDYIAPLATRRTKIDCECKTVGDMINNHVPTEHQDAFWHNLYNEGHDARSWPVTSGCGEDICELIRMTEEMYAKLLDVETRGYVWTMAARQCGVFAWG